MKELNLPLARLWALKGNLPPSDWVHRKYVDEFHDILSHLERVTQADLRACSVPESELVHEGGSEPEFSDNAQFIGHRIVYGQELGCERAYLLMKIESVLECFELSGRRHEVGFRPPAQ